MSSDSTMTAKRDLRAWERHEAEPTPAELAYLRLEWLAEELQ
jgi:DNA-binding transcriptional regulator YiaG